MARLEPRSERATTRPDGYRPLADYGLIGDGHGAALVSSAGSIDWCALPHLDSPPFLLRLLDAEHGGSFLIRPTASETTVTRCYLDNTAILDVLFRTDRGLVQLRDGFTTIERESHRDGDAEGRRHELVRLVTCLEGEVEVELRCRVTPDFARQVAVVDQQTPTQVRWRWPDGAIWLAGSWPLIVQADGTVGSRVTLRAGERLVSVLADTGPADVSIEQVSQRLEQTAAFWRSWAERCRYTGAYRAAVVRSALTLKLLSFEPTGAIVAAPTTSLPEVIGGARNWDYRYCWLRDATFTLYALGLLGYADEAHDFMHWIERVCMACGTDLQIMYGLRGERDLPERTLDHLSGYRNSRPVRVGNAAFSQRQLDVYGEVLDCAYLYY